ncbi:ferritin-like domain-containing protein [Paradesulfitobacterium ferrireducens]|uniref:ferritin-like domain-containing protein n=1 Tax=Paradesulfitobacterium ferrireducens TaxID=2816476 RepID=UPI001A8DB001|nr:ferritin-like domain-containing protein [Paradesulfitobacterium ferrireducens]
MKSSFEILSQILMGEHIAIDQYQAYIDALPASPLRNHLVAILTDHKEHATRLAYFIQTNGGHVQEGTGLGGMIAGWKTKLKHLRENEPLAMLEALYAGEDQGLAKAEELSASHLSASEQEIMAGIFEDERNHLKQLERLREDLLQ